MDLLLSPEILNFIFMMLSGVVATLIGFRKIGPKLGENAGFDAIHSKFLHHLKWLGVVMILLNLIPMVVFLKMSN